MDRMSPAHVKEVSGGTFSRGCVLSCGGDNGLENGPIARVNNVIQSGSFSPADSLSYTKVRFIAVQGISSRL